MGATDLINALQKHFARRGPSTYGKSTLPVSITSPLGPNLGCRTHDLRDHTVDGVHEFLEIANDFSNPLDVIREALSNSYDAGAQNISLLFEAPKEKNRIVLVITLRDDGEGMNREMLQAFFDLGNSSKRGSTDTIGEKGHGTKVYFNSKTVSVRTTREGITLIAEMNEPFSSLYADTMPKAIVDERPALAAEQGTEIVIKEYNSNEMALFTHARLKDYILWFTKHGSVERLFGISQNANVRVFLKGLDADEPECVAFGHVFHEQTADPHKLFDQYSVSAPDYFCKRVVYRGTLKNYPSLKYDAVFSIEGNRVKQQHNPMIRRQGYSAPEGAYRVQERYGLWVCKDYIPIQSKNECITRKGSEYTKFHAFFNCQEFRLTANRGSVDNTPADIHGRYTTGS